MSVEETLKTIQKKLDDLEKRISVLEGKTQTTGHLKPKKISIKEFLISKKPTNDVLKTLVIGYFLEKYENCTSFNVKDLEEGFRAAKEPVPKNINLAVIGNISKGHMMEDKGRKDKIKAWYLTNSGETYVDNDLKKN